MSQSGLTGKSHDIPKRLVWAAWLKVKGNGGAAGADGVTIEQFEERLTDNLYRLWNRMSSGSYFPGPVRAVEIPKKGGTRILGIPNVVDRVAQTAAVLVLEPEVEKVFHDDSYGYRPGRSPVDAVRVCRQRCFKKDWVVDLDVKAFFDSVPWELMLKAVARHAAQPWVMLYVQRWLKAPMLMPDGTLACRTKGTPQGGPISPLIANIFLHYGFDTWMSREFPGVGFERFADDVVVHCVTERQAHQMRQAIDRRFADIGLQVHPDKTRIVYCKDDRRRLDYGQVTFTFCGYAFRPRKTFVRGKSRTGFLPAVAPGKLADMSRKVASWRLHRRTTENLADLAEEINPALRGWLNYFTVFYPSAVNPIGKRVDRHLMRWGKWKYKRLKRSDDRARAWLMGVRQRTPNLFAHWTLRYTT
ncbi:group II intron reverse transcriptase/maturase [Micromonospora sp. WMMA1363]|uniref:group II intron reverse transcriptase/maturase n=1 Tax=Micromonospora sp. WMMA1363 TaxID=3053985 RepID=UPI00259D20C3|nr:group II intron reverse transcriptase/maturase [Micromonospora sp. WMMA1363]MDM4719570.1 group II intron reverse transcriptase/maturase [Micromonospora sp. WMMA1363]